MPSSIKRALNPYFLGNKKPVHAALCHALSKQGKACSKRQAKQGQHPGKASQK
jgi:hypothetical protein